MSPGATFFFNNPPSIVGLPLAAGVQHVGSLGPDYDTNVLEAIPPTALDPVGSPSNFATNAYIPNTPDWASPHETQSFQQAGLDTSVHRPLRPTQSITHPREAYLLKYFTQTWGPIFDCLDADSTFTKSVLNIALASSQSLFWAILATSALQLSRVSGYPFSAAKYYRSQCSKSIMPILLRSAEPNASEETLFATYVMLRNYDHMTGEVVSLTRRDRASY